MSEANKLRKETLSEKELSAELDAAEQLATEAEADAEENTEAPDHADQEDDADDADDESSAVEATLPDSRIEEMIEEAGEEVITATRAELQPVIEALLFVADEPLTFRQLGKILGDVDEKDVRVALDRGRIRGEAE